MTEERMKILKMLEDKKINAEEASKLLEALESSEKKDETFSTKGRKTLRIKVFENDLTKPKVNINVPLPLVKFLGKIIPDIAKTKLNKHGVSFEQILEMVEKEQVGKLVEVQEGNERVEIYIE
ncbi:MAG: hypothetical protein OEV55_03655 [candidate division Zixibacteria bacterium]|nr:hypothetical protein [candidate division Zixibacteria bacterium]